ncbi:MAG: zf-HC2 domain-containing protein [Vicinamibacteria bacterium]|nr:zf-HC2 domain-containing protein [Vicinamibacteria bacterium]
MSRASLAETLAWTFASDLCGDSPKAVALAKDLLKDVRKSGLKSPFAEALLRRLALAEWTKMDRPRPVRLDSRDPKESAILVFFLNAWGATYEDLAIALSVSEDRARHLVHKARMEQVASMTRIPIPKPECRRPRELLSDFREGLLPEPLAEDVAQHLRECRECTTLDLHLRTVLATPRKTPLEPPPELVAPETARPTLSLSLDGVSRAKRRAGVGLLAVGVLMGAVQLHPGLNASASAGMDRMTASFSRWRGRGERLMEDLRVLKALAIGTVEGRTEELSQTLDEYVNSGNEPETSSAKNKPKADAVLDSRDPKATPREQQSPRPVEGAPSPKNPS